MDVSIFERDGLVYARDLREAGDDIRYLRDEARRGTLQRVRRGAYCLRATWAAADGRERHILQVRAAVREVRVDALVAGRSAAALWGIPGAARWPEPVTLLTRPRGGGSSDADVRRTIVGFEHAKRFRVGGLACTGLARTAIDVARISGFADAVAVLDAVRDRRRSRPVTPGDLTHELILAAEARGIGRLRRAVDFSTGCSESVGESRARVAIHRLGYRPPQLQREFRDEQGSMFPDFFWADVDVALEFDGKVKYTRGEFTRGDPSGVVWREKQREDRLRRLVSRVERVVTADVEAPHRLDRILSNAGVARSRDRSETA